jgi:foldase protein PrsA
MIFAREEQNKNMHYNRLAPIAIAGLLVAIVLSGCGRGAFITVNGEKITKDEYYRRLEQMSINGQQAGSLMVQQMLKEELVLQLAKDKGVYPTDEQIEKKVEFAKKEGNLGTRLRQMGVTMEEYKKLLKPQQAQINIIIKGVKIPDADVKKYYEENKKTVFTRPETVDPAVIVCLTKDKLNKVQEQMKKGTDFTSVAMKLSDDPYTAPSGGRLGPLPRNVPNAPAGLLEAAFALKRNQISEPILIKPEGKNPQWVMIKLLDRKPERVTGYNEVKDQIREQLALQKGAQQVNVMQLLEKKRQTAKLTLPERYKFLGEVEKKADKTKKK